MNKFVFATAGSTLPDRILIQISVQHDEEIPYYVGAVSLSLDEWSSLRDILRAGLKTSDDVVHIEDTPEVRAQLSIRKKVKK